MAKKKSKEKVPLWRRLFPGRAERDDTDQTQALELPAPGVVGDYYGDPFDPRFAEAATEQSEDEKAIYELPRDRAGKYGIYRIMAADPSIAEALSGDDPLTVFAPTDEAFAALELTADNIGGLDQSFLTDVLLYHVTGGKLFAADVLAAEQIEMLKGGSLTQDAGVLTDNLGGTATIIVTDVEASNGVIHAIDAVVLPKAPPGS